jgi:hypothetical protein
LNIPLLEHPLRPPRTSAVALWAGVQCAALIAAAVGIHLWPHQPDPPESIALAEMVSVQVVAAALLFPVVCAGTATLAINLAVMAALQQLAGLLTVTPEPRVLSTTAFAGVWIVGLAGWARLARGGLAQSCATAMATVLSLGGALLWYVTAEAASQGGSPPPDALRFGPLVAGAAMASVPLPPMHVGWVITLVPGITAGPLIAWAALRSNPKVVPHFPTPPRIPPEVG